MRRSRFSRPIHHEPSPALSTSIRSPSMNPRSRLVCNGEMAVREPADKQSVFRRNSPLLPTSTRPCTSTGSAWAAPVRPLFATLLLRCPNWLLPQIRYGPRFTRRATATCVCLLSERVEDSRWLGRVADVQRKTSTAKGDFGGEGCAECVYGVSIAGYYSMICDIEGG